MKLVAACHESGLGCTTVDSHKYGTFHNAAACGRLRAGVPVSVPFHWEQLAIEMGDTTAKWTASRNSDVLAFPTTVPAHVQFVVPEQPVAQSLMIDMTSLPTRTSSDKRNLRFHEG